MSGTSFPGRAVVEDALPHEWEVTVFNRSRSGTVPEGARKVRGDRTVAVDRARLDGEGSWDAVVDTSASEVAPRDVLADARTLEPVAGRYVYVSTVNACCGWPVEDRLHAGAGSRARSTNGSSSSPKRQACCISTEKVTSHSWRACANTNMAEKGVPLAERNKVGP
ncbi:hypothetical protein [Streptomyces sp. NPDC006285]|uniref:hypothetical protein n=1 Tax=Streptomyces sp. NPDC006285 TaxID=3364742 RepID=UPI0036977C8C